MRIIFHITIPVILLVFLAHEESTAQDTLAFRTDEMKVSYRDPVKATMLAATLPGLGQIYNRKYWKVPLVYAGFGAVGYAVWYNTTWYNRYIKGYQDFTDMIPATDSYIELISNIRPEEYDPVLHPATANPSTAAWIKDQMMRQIDYFRKYRDLSYLGIAAWYLFTILDANVDASLFDYDIGESLALKISPIQNPFSTFAGAGVNFTLIINF